jgi:hypothetical protein
MRSFPRPNLTSRIYSRTTTIRLQGDPWAAIQRSRAKYVCMVLAQRMDGHGSHDLGCSPGASHCMDDLAGLRRTRAPLRLRPPSICARCATASAEQRPSPPSKRAALTRPPLSLVTHRGSMSARAHQYRAAPVATGQATHPFQRSNGAVAADATSALARRAPIGRA